MKEINTKEEKTSVLGCLTSLISLGVLGFALYIVGKSVGWW